MQMNVANNAGVYAIINTMNGKRYIGSSKRMRNRLNEHKRKLSSNSHFNVKLQNAYAKYGIGAFEFVPILICSEENLVMYEQIAIDGFDSVSNGYNIRPNAESQRGHKFGSMPEERRKKISDAQKGKPREYLIGNKHTLGYKASEETKEKMSIALTGRVVTPETRAKISAANTGKKRPLMVGNKYAANAPPKTEKWKIAIASLKGRKLPPFTDAHREKMSIAAKARCARNKLASEMDVAQKQSNRTTEMVELNILSTNSK